MDYTGSKGRKPDWGFSHDGLSTDEQAVLDHVSGLTRVLPAPSGEACEDREFVGELVAMRSQLGAMAIHPPKMRLSFDDVLQAVEQTPQPPTDNRVIYWLTGRWGVGLVAAASVCLAFLTGMAATGEYDIQPSASLAQEPAPDLRLPDALAPDHEEAVASGAFGSIVRQGSIQLRHSDPAEIQRLVTEMVTSSGGHVTSLTRQGRDEEAEITLAVAVPAEKYRKFKSGVGELGEVLAETESAEDVTAQSVDLKARLAEAEDYLARLDELIETPTDLSSLQNLERERRKTRLEIEQYRQSLSALQNRVALSRLDITVTTAEPQQAAEQGAFTQAVDDGVKGLGEVSAFLLKSGIAGSPFLLAGAIAMILLRRKRRKLVREYNLAA